MENNNELQWLQNAANKYGLTVFEKHTHDKRKTKKLYFVSVGTLVVSPCLDYESLNHFILGYNIGNENAKLMLSDNQIQVLKQVIYERLIGMTMTDNEGNELSYGLDEIGDINDLSELTVNEFLTKIGQPIE